MSTTNHETAQGLRALADLLDAHPDLTHPWDGYDPCILHPISSEADPKAAMRDWAKATSHLRPTKNFDTWASLFVDFGGGIVVQVYASREQVCEKVVTGTREVTKSVKDPDALAAIPTVEVTETLEDVEWICRPLLAASDAEVSA